MTDNVARTIACTTLLVSAVAFYLQVETGRERIENSRIVTENRCDSGHRRGFCYAIGSSPDDPDSAAIKREVISAQYDDGWYGARDKDGFPIASEEAKHAAARCKSHANPLYVEKYGRCP